MGGLGTHLGFCQARAWVASIPTRSLRTLVRVLYSLVGSTRANAVRAGAKRVLVPWWLIVAVAVGLIASVALPDREPLRSMFGDRAGMIVYAVRVALAVVGLVLVERLFRSTAAHARWAVKPLCLGLTGVFGFDLFFFSDAMLFGRHDLDIWVARGVAHALVIPLLAVAAARNPAWTIEMHLSRGAVLRSTALLASGVFLLAVAAAGYFVRFVGGELGKALQIEFLFAALLLLAFAVFSGSFRSKLKVFVSKHFFAYRYDYREEWLRFTRTLSADSSPQGIQQRSINALADLVESPAGALWLRQGDQSFRPAARWNMAGSRVERQTPLREFWSGRDLFHRLRAYLGTGAPLLFFPMARFDAVSVARCPTPVAHGLVGLSYRHCSRVHQGGLGGAGLAEDRGQAGGKLPRSDSSDRSIARDA